MPENLPPASEELHSLLGDLLRTRHISQPLVFCDSNDDSQSGLELMQARGFSVLAVRERDRIVGSVTRQTLDSGTCGEQQQPLAEGDVIDGEEPLLTLLRTLEYRHWLFVRGGGEISGFVSRSDLQRGPVRMLLFGLISLFEMMLVDLVQAYYTESAIMKTLSNRRLNQARRLHDEREKRGEELHLVDCLQIADKRDLLLAADGCAPALGFESINAASRFFGKVEELRDRLVHANDLVAGSSWEEVLATTLQLADFLSRCARMELPR